MIYTIKEWPVVIQKYRNTSLKDYGFNSRVNILFYLDHLYICNGSKGNSGDAYKNNNVTSYSDERTECMIHLSFVQHTLHVSGDHSFSNVRGFVIYSIPLWLSNAHCCMFSLRHYFLFCSPSMPNNNDGKDLAHRLDKWHTHCQLPPPAPFVCLLCTHYQHW